MARLLYLFRLEEMGGRRILILFNLLKTQAQKKKAIELWLGRTTHRVVNSWLWNPLKGISVVLRSVALWILCALTILLAAKVSHHKKPDAVASRHPSSSKRILPT